MEIEYEATFLDIDKDIIRKKLESIDAKLLKPKQSNQTRTSRKEILLSEMEG